MWQKALAVLAALTLVVAAGCGGDKPASTGGGGGGGGAAKTDKPKDKPKKATGGEAYSKDKGTGSIKGVVSVEGTVTPPKQIDIGGDAKCAAMHKDPLLSESVVAKDGKLQNVIVYIK